MAYLHMYSNPTSGGVDGTLISENTGLAPFTLTLNASNNEVSSATKLALRCETNFQTSSGTSTVITPTGKSSTVSGTNDSGQAIINVADGTVFRGGESIIIGTGGTVETKVIQSISTNALTLTTSLVNSHSNGETVISNSSSKWYLAPDSSGSAGEFGSAGGALTITEQITTINKIFWIKASSTETEIPWNDNTVYLNVTAQVESTL